MNYEIDFLSVGESNGDAICLRYGTDANGYSIHVVDGGYTDTGQTIVDHIETNYGAPRFLDHVVLSHADADHVSGLSTVIQHFDVGTLWMNRPWLYAVETLNSFHGNFTADGLNRRLREAYPRLVELENIAIAKGIPIEAPFAGARIGPFTVLAPTRERYISLIPEFDATPASYAIPEKGLIDQVVKAIKRFFETWGNENLEEDPPAVSANNESSVVQLGNLDGQFALLTADAGPRSLIEAADIAAWNPMLQSLNFVQVPHHGSRRNVTPSVLNRWLGLPVQEGVKRGIAFCSVGRNKPDYPRKRVQNAFLRRGYGVIPNRDGWISHFRGMPSRPGSKSVHPEPFVPQYDE